MREPKKILVVRTDRIGDVILSTPVIENLRLAFPESHIAFMCRPYTKDILEGNPYLNEVIVYDKYAKHKSAVSSIRFCRYLKRQKFDWAIVLHPTNRAHILTFFAGIPFRVGWRMKMGFLLTKRITHTKQLGERHELQYTLDILRQINIPVTAERAFIPENEPIQSWADGFLKDNNIDYKKDKLIGLGIGASCPSKIWPPGYFAELARILKDNLGAKIIVFAQDREHNLTSEFSRKFGDDFVDLTGKASLLQIFSLFRRLAIFIGNDSGLIHVGWALGRPVISIFGRNNPGLSPNRWRPLGSSSFFFHKEVGCGNCLAHNCKRGSLCLKAIKPRQVADKALEILNEGHSGNRSQ